MTNKSKSKFQYINHISHSIR